MFSSDEFGKTIDTIFVFCFIGIICVFIGVPIGLGFLGYYLYQHLSFSWK